MRSSVALVKLMTRSSVPVIPPSSPLPLFPFALLNLDGVLRVLPVRSGGRGGEVAEVEFEFGDFFGRCGGLFGRVAGEVERRADAVAARVFGAVEGAVGGRHQKVARAGVGGGGGGAQ